MNKIINAILAIGTAIIISLFFMLAMKMAFDVDYVDCYEKELGREPMQINKNISSEDQAKLNECYDTNRQERDSASKKIFISSVIVGAILTILIIPLLFLPSLSAGVGASGIFLIVYGFARGWETSGDLIKLVLLLITTILIIGITLFLNKPKKGKKKK